MPDPKLSRRGALAAMGTVSLGGLLAACGKDDDGEVTTEAGTTATVEPTTTTSAQTAARFDESASCRLTPEQTEGPYYFDVDSIRSDIREDRKGTPLHLAIRVRDAESCEPLRNAVVDIWHCDAEGSYSGFEAASAGGPSGRGRSDEETYCRGAQVTNAEGVAEFTTVYPGAYTGRTPHIHAKVHIDRQTVLTTQLYFDDAFTDKVHRGAPYAAAGERESRNDSDGIFDKALLMTTSTAGDGARGVMTFDVERA